MNWFSSYFSEAYWDTCLHHFPSPRRDPGLLLPHAFTPDSTGSNSTSRNQDPLVNRSVHSVFITVQVYSMSGEDPSHFPTEPVFLWDVNFIIFYRFFWGRFFCFCFLLLLLLMLVALAFSFCFLHLLLLLRSAFAFASALAFAPASALFFCCCFCTCSCFCFCNCK